MAIAFVQESHNSASSSSSFTITPTITNGNYLVVALAMSSDTGVTSTVSDSLGNSFSRVVRQADGNGVSHVELWAAQVTTGGADTVTVSFDSPITAAASLTEWSGVDMSNPGQTSGSSGSSSAAPTTGSVTVSTAGTTLVGAMMTGLTAVTDAGTNRANVVFGSGSKQLDVESYGGLSASQAAMWTLGGSSSWAAAGVTLVPPSTPFGIEDEPLTVSPVVTW